MMFPLLVLLAVQQPDSVRPETTMVSVTVGVPQVTITRWFTTLDTIYLPVPVPPDTATPPVDSLPPAKRTVNVATMVQLKAAIEAALPGDRIVLVAGNYDLAAYAGPAAKNGTKANPIVITGPRTAIMSGGSAPFLVTGNYWILNGFRITKVVNSALQILRGNHNVIQYMELDHSGSHALAIRTGPSSQTSNGLTLTGTVIRHNLIHDTGTATAVYGEGIYLGDGWGNQRVLNTYIHHNVIGPNIGAESIEAKVAADSNRIEFNTVVGGYLVIRSDHNKISDNTLSGRGPNDGHGANGNALLGVGSDVPGDIAINNVFRRNRGSNEKYLFFDYGGGTSKMYCDNVAVAPTMLGVTCIS